MVDGKGLGFAGNQQGGSAAGYVLLSALVAVGALASFQSLGVSSEEAIAGKSGGETVSNASPMGVGSTSAAAEGAGCIGCIRPPLPWEELEEENGDIEKEKPIRKIGKGGDDKPIRKLGKGKTVDDRSGWEIIGDQISRWVEASGIGNNPVVRNLGEFVETLNENAGRWALASVGSAASGVLGSGFGGAIAQAFERVITPVFNWASTLAQGVLTANAAVLETVAAGLATPWLALADATQLDRLLGAEFDDYGALWSYPLTKLFASASSRSFSATIDGLKNMFAPFDKVGKQLKRSPVSATANAWPYEIKKGEQTDASLLPVLDELGIDLRRTTYGSGTEVKLSDGRVLIMSEAGSDAEGYSFVAMLAEDAGDEGSGVLVRETLHIGEGPGAREQLRIARNQLISEAFRAAQADPQTIVSSESKLIYEMPASERSGKSASAMIEINSTPEAYSVKVLGETVDVNRRTERRTQVDSVWQFEGSLDETGATVLELVDTSAERDVTMIR